MAPEDEIEKRLTIVHERHTLDGTLAEKNVKLRHPLQVIIFQNEEGGTYGSHAIGVGLDEKDLGRVSQSGKTLREGITFIGGDPSRVASVKRQRGSIAGYFELHIEQGGTLEQAKAELVEIDGELGARIIGMGSER